MAGTDGEIVLQVGQKGIEVNFLIPSTDEAAEKFEKAVGTEVVPPFDIQIGCCVV